MGSPKVHDPWIKKSELSCICRFLSKCGLAVIICSAFQHSHERVLEFTEMACLKLMKALIAIQGVHPYSFSSQLVLPPILDFCYKKITDPEAYTGSFDRFLIQCMILFKHVLECKEYKPNNIGRVVGETVITLEQTKKNITREAEDILKSLMVQERVVLLCNILIRRYVYTLNVV
eukprot:Gb_10008 [translate_table: standard]